MGKSRSINHFIREIIGANRQKNWMHPMPVIVFEHRKDKIVWLFVPETPESRSTNYEAFSVRRSDFDAISTSFGLVVSSSLMKSVAVESDSQGFLS